MRSHRLFFPFLKHILFSVTIYICSFIQGQDVTGNYQGIITQSEGYGALSNAYAYWMDIWQEGDSVNGRTRIEVANTEKYGIILIHGKIKENRLEFSGFKILDENIRQFGAVWCLINAELLFSDDLGSLKGTWKGNMGCGNGRIFLNRSLTTFNDSTSQRNNYITNEYLVKNIGDRSLISYKKVVMESIYFEYNSYDLNEISKKNLSNLISILRHNMELSINVLAHTDNVGSSESNFKLSVKRAQSVVDYLTANGIDKKRCFYEGFGESRPIADNRTNEGRARNRRIEFEVF